MQLNEKSGVGPQKMVNAPMGGATKEPAVRAGFKRKAIVSSVQGVATYGGRTPAVKKNAEPQVAQKKVSVQQKQQSPVKEKKMPVQANLQLEKIAVGGRGAKALLNTKSKASVKITYLGGVGEIGKNMTAIEQGNEIIVVLLYCTINVLRIIVFTSQYASF